MTKAQFQEAHGPVWSKIIAEPSFFAAMRVCSSERLRDIENLTATEIEANGKVHLASFQGHLKTESILIGLAAEAQGEGFDLPTADYGAPVDADRPAWSPPVFEPSAQPKPKTRKRK